MGALPACMLVFHMCAWFSQRSEESTGCPRERVKDGSEPTCGCWDLNLGPLEEQPILSAPEPSLQSTIKTLISYK